MEQGKLEYKNSTKKIIIILDGEELLRLSNDEIRNAIYNKVKNKQSEDVYYARIVDCTQDEMSYEYENDRIEAKINYNEMFFEDDI